LNRWNGIFLGLALAASVVSPHASRLAIAQSRDDVSREEVAPDDDAERREAGKRFLRANRVARDSR